MTSTWRPGTATSSAVVAVDSEEFPDSNYVETAHNQPQFSGSVVNVYDKKYVENLRKTYAAQMAEKRSVRNNQKIGSDQHHVHRRLREYEHPCDLNTLTCLMGTCGRSFDRIQVLAFHISYAHQDLMTLESNNLTCLLCGKKWTTVRRKIMHLSLAHREIGEEHNSQCMLQVESVIAPNAPKALRLEKARRIYDDRILKPPLFEDTDPFVEEVTEDADYQY